MTEMYSVIRGADSFYYKGNETGILISHGFMGTPQSVKYIGGRLAQYGYTILAPRLKGHGTHYHDLEKCTYDEWFESLERGYQELQQQCNEIFVLGQSMGGTLALWLAHKHQDIKGIILLNAALEVPAFEHLKGKHYPRIFDEGKPDIKAKDVYEITYHKTPIKAVHELQKLMEITPAILPNVHCPILGFKSVEDHVVPPENTDYIIEHAGSDIKKSLELQNSFHVASMDNEKDEIVKNCHQFVQQQVGQEVACFTLGEKL